jgi:hypothetical protein
MLSLAAMRDAAFALVAFHAALACHTMSFRVEIDLRASSDAALAHHRVSSSCLRSGNRSLSLARELVWHLKCRASHGEDNQCATLNTPHKTAMIQPTVAVTLSKSQATFTTWCPGRLTAS